MLSCHHEIMRHEVVVKMVGASGQLTLGKKYSGRHFEVEELASGELMLRPVRLVRDTPPGRRAKAGRAPAFRIAEVQQVILPTREQRNARRK